MKAFAAGTADLGHKSGSSKARDYMPVSVSIGLIFLSISFGLYTARHQILHSPGVHVKKSRRETIPEVVEPETVTHESEEFLTKSFFRKIAHVQDFDIVIPNKPGKDSFSYRPKVETLKSVGVDPSHE